MSLADTIQRLVDRIGTLRLAIGVLVGAVAIGFTGGITAVTVATELGAVPDSVRAHTMWIARHDSLLYGPGRARLEALEDEVALLHQVAVEDIQVQVDYLTELVYELHCDHFPDRCKPRPQPGGSP